MINWSPLPLGNGVDWQVVDSHGSSGNRDLRKTEKKIPLEKDAKTDWEVVQETVEDNDKNEESGDNDNSNDTKENEDTDNVDMYWLTKQLISMYHQQSSPTLCHVTSSFSRGR